MATYPPGLPVGFVSLSIYDLIGDLGATGDADDLPDVADVTLTVEMIPTAKMITYGGKGYRLRAYTWTGMSVLTAPDGTGSYTLPATTTLTQAGTAWQWQARISVAAGSVTTQLTTPPFDLAAGATVDLLPLIPVEAQSLDVAALVIVPPGGLPSQSGNAGKVLTTDGVSATWTTAPTGGGAAGLVQPRRKDRRAPRLGQRGHDPYPPLRRHPVPDVGDGGVRDCPVGRLAVRGAVLHDPGMDP